ncbi:hypothetical protein [Sulfurimonas sp.]
MNLVNKILVILLILIFTACEDKKTADEKQKDSQDKKTITTKSKKQPQVTASDKLRIYMNKNNVNLGWHNNKLYIFSEVEKKIDKNDKNFVDKKRVLYDLAVTKANKKVSDFIGSQVEAKDNLSSSKVIIDSNNILTTISPIKKEEVYSNGIFSIAILMVWEQNKKNILGNSRSTINMNYKVIEEHLSNDDESLLLGSRIIKTNNSIIIIGIGISQITDDKYSAKKASQLLAKREIYTQLETKITSHAQTELKVSNSKVMLRNTQYVIKNTDIKRQGLIKIKSKIVKERISGQDMYLSIYAIEKKIQK